MQRPAIATSLIVVPPNRQRKSIDPKALEDLANSIRTKGLLHAIVLRQSGEDAGNSHMLVAGERRLRAFELLQTDPLEGDKYKCIPYTFLSDLDPIAQREAELEENVVRVDLSWQEKCAAVDELHRLRLANDPNHLAANTASEIAAAKGITESAAQQLVSRSRIVAAKLDDPRVAGSRSLKEAYNIVSRDMEADLSRELAGKIGQSTSQVFIQGSCLDVLQTFDKGSFDCIIADPPYGMGADSFGSAGSAHHYDDTTESALAINIAILDRGMAITKDAAHLYLFCDVNLFVSLKGLAQKFGWTVFNTPIIWDKGGGTGHDPMPNLGFRRSYETLLYAFKGNRPHLVFMNDIIKEIPPVRNATHAAEKPIELYKRLLERSCRAGDSVLDPCCGTGPVFPAANQLFLRATGIELNPAFAKLADARRFAKL